MFEKLRKTIRSSTSNKRKILICGDSYAANWHEKPTGDGWPNFLESEFDVTNLAVKGASQYRIWLQLSKQNMKKYDTVIICHTTPFRIYIPEHPVHSKDIQNQECDLIYSDIEHHSNTDKALVPIKEYFEQYFDIDQAKFMHSLLCDKMIDYTSAHPNVIHMTGFKELGIPSVDLLNVGQRTKIGFTNHLSPQDNQLVYQEILNRIQHTD